MCAIAPLVVIGTWLAENTDVIDPVMAAEKLIHATAQADLIIVLKADFESFIADIIIKNRKG